MLMHLALCASTAAKRVMKMSDVKRRYSELIKIPTYLDRYEYLRINGRVGEDTFGFDRWLNQKFYHDKVWKRTKSAIIARDLGCDMAMDGYEIYGRIYVHHLNPITYDDIVNQNLSALLDPEFLVCVSHSTHEAIHYGDKNLLRLHESPVERRPNDTCLWKE